MYNLQLFRSSDTISLYVNLCGLECSIMIERYSRQNHADPNHFDFSHPYPTVSPPMISKG